jgi:hypothetical protein
MENNAQIDKQETNQSKESSVKLFDAVSSLVSKVIRGGSSATRIPVRLGETRSDGVDFSNKDYGGSNLVLSIKDLFYKMRFFWLLIALLILVYTGAKLIYRARSGVGDRPGFTDVSKDLTPTTALEDLSQDSSSENAQILNLEKEINLIVQELSSVSLKETDLVPPVLDFDIQFEK